MISDVDNGDGFWDPPADDDYNPGGPQPHPNDEPAAPPTESATPQVEKPNTPVPTGTTPPPPSTNTPAPKPNAPSQPSTPTSTYKPPSFTPSPFITPDGKVPPGLPFSPDPHAVELQNQALEKVLNTPAVQPFVNPYQSSQDALIQKFLNEPQYDQTYVNSLNEQQKEIALAREQQARRGILQSSAGRGVQAGGQVQAGFRRAGQDTTQNLLQSQRDIDTRVHDENRAGFERALGLSDQLAGGMSDRLFRTDSANRASLLDALASSENIYGGREDRGLNVSRFMETIRQFDNDMKERQAEFGANNQFGYDTLNTNSRFNYDQLNNMNEQAWLNYLARLAGR